MLVYDGTNFDAIVEDLREEIAKWPDEDQSKFYFTGYNNDQLIMHHHGLGRWIRNNYRLWEVKWTPQYVDDVDWSPEHPDTVSMRIIEEAWKKGPKR